MPGKPHWEQGQEDALSGGPPKRPVAPLEAPGNRRPREMAIQTQNPAYRMASTMITKTATLTALAMLGVLWHPSPRILAAPRSAPTRFTHQQEARWHDAEGKRLMAIGNTSAAIAHWREALRLTPDDPATNQELESALKPARSHEDQAPPHVQNQYYDAQTDHSKDLELVITADSTTLYRNEKAHVTAVLKNHGRKTAILLQAWDDPFQAPNEFTATWAMVRPNEMRWIGLTQHRFLCGLREPISSGSIFELKPGESKKLSVFDELEDVGVDSLGYVIPGQYKVVLTYVNMAADPSSISASDQDTLKRIEKSTRCTVVSNQVTITKINGIRP
jgi:hypothetical protein